MRWQDYYLTLTSKLLKLSRKTVILREYSCIDWDVTNHHPSLVLLHPVVCKREHALFTLFLFVFAQWCPKHIVLCFCFVFLCLLHPMLPVSLDCPFLIAPSVFSNVYLQISEGWGFVTSQSIQLYSRSMTVLRLSFNNFEVNVK
jgi:hypothetical protein